MIDQAQQHHDTKRRVAILVGLLVAVGAVLRFWNLGGGLPSSLGVDEPQIMVRSLTMVKTGDFHPHFFDYPSFYLYLQAGVIVARFLAGASSGAWAALSQVTDYDFYLWGRMLTAAFGTATVYLVYRVSSHWGTRQALLATALFAVLPLHVRESHYVLTDVPMTFFVTLALALALQANEDGKFSTFAWAGAAAGLAAGTKYTAWVSLLMPLLAAVWVRGPVVERVKRGLAALAAFPVAFLIVAPYTVLDLPGFLDGFAALAAAVPKRPASAEAGWVIYAKHLRIALGWPAAALGLVGILAFAERALRAPRRAPYAMTLVFVGVFWLMVIDRTLIFARYLMPICPFVCLFVSVPTVGLLDWLGKQRLPRQAWAATSVVVVAVALAQPVISAVTFDHEMGRRWTDSVAMEWIVQNVKPGSRVVHEAASLHFPPGRYDLDYTRSLIDKGFDAIAGERTDYVIASSAVFGRYFSDPGRFPARYVAYRDLFRRLVPATTIQPSADHPGPEIRIFTLPPDSAK